MNKKWHLLCCKRNCEKKLVASLNRRKIEHYSPLNRVEKIERNKKIILSEPLFPMYVFVNISGNEIATIKGIDSVLNFVYWLGSPLVIKDQEIDHIECFINQHSNIKLRKISVDNMGAVEEVNEYFKNENTNGGASLVNKTVYKLLLPLMGYALLADKEKATTTILNTGSKRADLFSKF